MTVQITDEIRWINECYPIEGKHLHISTYLLTYEDTHILVDTGSFYHRERIRKRLETALDGSIVDTIFLSQPDLLHSGNVPMFREDPNVDLICFTGNPPLHGYSDVISAKSEDEIDVRGRRFSFVDPVVADVASTAWIYDHESRSLFTSDGFGHYHDPGSCDSSSQDLAGGVDRRQIRSFHERTLRWLAYTDPRLVEAATRRIFDSYDVRRIFPVHGHPIVDGDVDSYVNSFIDAVKQIADGYDPD